MHRALSSSIAVLVAAIASNTAVAANLRVPITIKGDAGRAVAGSVTLTPVAVPGLNKSQTLTAPVELPGLFAVANIDAGTWMVEVRAPGYWHPPVVQLVAEPSADIPVTVWPTATISGKLEMPPGKPLPKQLLVRFQSAPSVGEAERIPIAEIKCPVEVDRWSCHVPTGVLDLRVRAESFQTHFFWDTVVSRHKANELGAIKLRTGSSLIGTVKLAPGVKGNLAKVKVSLQPLTFVQSSKDSARAGMRAQGGAVNARGFFRLEGVAAGDYVVVARLDAASSPPIKVRLLADREIELVDALSVAPPRSLSISITPPVAPDLRPWRVALLAEAGPPGRVDFITEENATADGLWRRKDVLSGHYVIRVKDSTGNTWLTHALDTDADSTDIALTVPLTTVQGTVKLGEEPLAAKVIFGGRGASISIPLQADEDGRFNGVIPRNPTMLHRVSVESVLPPLSRVLLEPEYHATSDGGVRLDLNLAVTHLVGDVVGPDGQPSNRALVRIKSDEHDWQSEVEVGPDGRFEAFGQAPGWVTVQASAYLLESSPARVELKEESTARLQLVLRPVGTLSGRIVGAVGVIAGAQVTVTPLDSQPLVVIPVTTNVKGQFTATVQPGAVEASVFVEAFGFATKMFRLALPDHPIDIPLDQNGGTLTVWAPEFDGFEQTPKPFLLHAGATRLLHTIAGATFEREEKRAGVRVRVPMLERGIYSVCFVSPGQARQLNEQSLPKDRCATGFVPPLGELSLSLSGPQVAGR